MPPHLAAYRRTWADLHPGWEHWLWDEGSLGWLQNRDLFDRAEEITPHVGQFRSDLARYEILLHHGGAYVDCDMEARKPIDDLLHCDVFACRETDTFLNIAVIGSAPNHPLFADLVDGLPARVAACDGMGWRPNRITGPHYFTPAARRHGVTELPQEAFYPYAYDELDRANEEFPDSYAVHHWDNKRKLKGVPRV